MSEQDRKSPDREEDIEENRPANEADGGTELSAERKDRPAELHFPSPEPSDNGQPSDEEGVSPEPQAASEESAVESGETGAGGSEAEHLEEVMPSADAEEPPEDRYEPLPVESDSPAEAPADISHENESESPAVPPSNDEQPASEGHGSDYVDERAVPPPEAVPEEAHDEMPEETAPLSIEEELSQSEGLLGSWDSVSSRDEDSDEDEKDESAPEEILPIDDEEEDSIEQSGETVSEKPLETPPSPIDEDMSADVAEGSSAIAAEERPASEEPLDFVDEEYALVSNDSPGQEVHQDIPEEPRDLSAESGANPEEPGEGPDEETPHSPEETVGEGEDVGEQSLHELEGIEADANTDEPESEPEQSEEYPEPIENRDEGENLEEVQEEAGRTDEEQSVTDEAENSESSGDEASSGEKESDEAGAELSGPVVPPAVVISGTPAAVVTGEAGPSGEPPLSETGTGEVDAEEDASEGKVDGDLNDEVTGTAQEGEGISDAEEHGEETPENEQPAQVVNEGQAEEAITEPVAEEESDADEIRNEVPVEEVAADQESLGQENLSEELSSSAGPEGSALNGVDEIVNEEENGGAEEPEVREEVVDDLAHIIESIIFASDEPLPVATIKSVLDAAHTFGRVNPDMITSRVSALNAKYEADGTGFHIVEIANGFQYATRKEMAQWVSNLFKERSKRRLSNSALETVAIIAYKQPITKPEIESIRGVNVDYVLHNLLEKELVTVTGRAETVGRPLLYGTTQKFLKVFSLKNLDDLPKLREIDEIIKEIRSKGAEESIQLEITALGDSSSPDPTTDSETNQGAPSDNGTK